jgi:hypothetical protein
MTSRTFRVAHLLEDSESLRVELDETMQTSKRDASKISRTVRVIAYGRLLLALAAGVITIRLNASLSTVLVTTLVATGWAVVAAVCDWADRAQATHVFLGDQALKLHDAQVASVGRAVEAAVHFSGNPFQNDE